MDRSPRSKRPLVRAAALVLLVGLLLGLVVGPAACGNDDDSSDDPPPTTTSATTESEVESAYLAYWEMGARLLEAPDPDDPEIPERASGEALADLVAGLEALKSANLRSELGSQYAHNVIGVEVENDGRAVVDDCAVDDSRLVDAATGEVVEQSVVTELIRVTMLRDGDRWRADSSVQVDAWEGAVECR